MKANIPGRVNKLRAVSNYKIPLLEGVANSIQSLLSSKIEQPLITVKIIFESEATYPNEKNASRYYHKIKDIEITDNGAGFNEKNFESFETMDSDLKTTDFGCKGIGRFYWLKAFSSVSIDSVFISKNGDKKRRQFDFSIDDIQNHHLSGVPKDQPIGTTVTLHGLHETVQNKQEVTLDDISRVIVNHFLLEFVNKQVPEIVVTDGYQIKRVNDEFGALESSEPLTCRFQVQNYDFELIQQRLNVKAKKSMSSGLYYCAGNRVVGKASSLLNPKFDSILEDESGNELLYVGLLKSSLFDSLVNSDRTAIVYPDGTELNLYPSEREVLQPAEALSEEYLSPELKRIESLSKETLDHFANEEAPEYKGFLNEHAAELYIKPNSSTSEIRDYLSTQYFQYERQQKSAVDKLIEVEWSEEDAEEKISEIEKKIRPIATHDLVRFAAQRAYYLKMFAKAIKVKTNTAKNQREYQPEEVVHSLIFPMGKDSTDFEGMDQQNLWLIDDRLTFNYYLSSDKAFRNIPIINDNSLKRPDIFVAKLFSLGEHPSNAMELSIIEFKRPGRSDYTPKENPLTQVLDYVLRIRNGKETSSDGEEITDYRTIPINCYVVAQLTENLRNSCKMYGLQQNAIEDSFYGFNPHLQAYIEVMSLNALFRKAKERNHALLRAAKLENID